jgi:hypothetical protein
VVEFERWKTLSSAAHIAKSLGFESELALSGRWNDYTKRFVAANGDEGHMIEAARKLAGKMSTGEVAVLSAMLHAGDYSHVADQLHGPSAWTKLGRVRGEYAEAVAMAIMRQ